jgi:hypothetical protein
MDFSSPPRAHRTAAGAAPDALRFEVGLHGLVPPLLTFGPGDGLL